MTDFNMCEDREFSRFKRKPHFLTTALYRELPHEVIENLNLEENADFEKFLERIAQLLPVNDSLSVKRLGLNRVTLGVKLEQKNFRKNIQKTKKTELSQRERRILGLYRLPRNSIKYKDALKMYNFWSRFMEEFLNLNQIKHKTWYDPEGSHLWESLSITLLRADYHGAKVKVIRSKCPSMVGHEGIVIFDTKYTFSIIGEDNVTRVIPKLTSIFELTVKQYKFTIYGKYFCIRTAERSTRKIKHRFIPIL